MIVDRGGRTYGVLVGSHIDRDVLYLEMRDVTDGEAGPVVLYDEETADGELRMCCGSFEALEAPPCTVEPSFLPLTLVEEFLGWMKVKLSSS